jgi:hypothetical protein
MLIWTLLVKLAEKTFAAAIQAAWAAAAFAPKFALKLAVNVGVMTNWAEAGAVRAKPVTIEKIAYPNDRA